MTPAAKRRVRVRVFDSSEGYWFAETVPDTGDPEAIARGFIAESPLFCSGPGQVQVGSATFDYGRRRGAAINVRLRPGTWNPANQDFHGRTDYQLGRSR